MKRYQVLKAPQSGFVVYDMRSHCSEVFGSNYRDAIRYAREKERGGQVWAIDSLGKFREV